MPLEAYVLHHAAGELLQPDVCHIVMLLQPRACAINFWLQPHPVSGFDDLCNK